MLFPCRLCPSSPSICLLSCLRCCFFLLFDCLSMAKAPSDWGGRLGLTVLIINSSCFAQVSFEPLPLPVRSSLPIQSAVLFRSSFPVRSSTSHAHPSACLFLPSTCLVFPYTCLIFSHACLFIYSALLYIISPSLIFSYPPSHSLFFLFLYCTFLCFFTPDTLFFCTPGG